ncbi:sugar ABC transporter ATP-binding protein [Gordoniibacillus kamchatkensis]|uniref:Sugar ABC transporter ATP-binding protein n=1 Tax=Gordoniibacillus kamchatkensis TaxID=1590651 RepID=A0ABR5AD37_9BACL|nr:carbohydrate ABC transporter permease [Paenibacillus sp. VKM B-2647]KIL38953.1 sugar ABC transporter ATP-binding protein [Paenibacillus sp. VKM B-2647]
MLARRRVSHGELSLGGKIVVYGLLLLGLLLFAFPLFWMIITSLKDLGDVHKLPMTWIPNPIRWSNYAKVFHDAPLERYIVNTVAYTAVTMVAVALSSSLVAFGFARLRARGSKYLFLLVLATMMIPPQVTMIPQYLLFNKFNWVDSYLPLVIPAFGGSAFIIFLLRQFYLGFSRELDEAVKIDGGGFFTIYARIILPLSIPSLATAAILEFMYRWNDLIGPLIYLSDGSKYPLSLGLSNFTAAYAATPWNLLMAASIVAVAPPLLLFFFAQKYFIQGIVITGSKG